ncbi:MAG: acetoin utilization protein [Paracoccaceae bacterium]|nr:MAG: acetoin utilization protein [Paracoccaceae bacterium]
MTTALLTHEACLRHVTPRGHPERAARLEAIARALDAPAFAGLMRESAPAGDDALLRLAHPQRHIDRLRASLPAEGFHPLDPDTWLSPGSLQAAQHAAGAQRRAAELVMSGTATNAFLAVRPPGHHAEAERPMGFCLFANAVLAARSAIELGAGRVAIVDFDVHHGNGTQALVWDDPDILFISTHQMPLWPGTGAPDERGAHGNVLNIPLPPGSDGSLMRERAETLILPALDAFRPDLMVISAGFDAHAADPLAGLEWVEDDYAWLTGRLCAAARRLCGGRVISTLEGGYDLDALAGSVAAHVATLMEWSR